MRTDSGMHGLTTAATVWVNAALGIAVGGGEYRLAFIGTVVTIAALLVLHPIEIALARRLRGAGTNAARQTRLLTSDRAGAAAPPGSARAGRPASTHAAVITEATSRMESPSRCSSIGRILAEEQREILIVVRVAAGDGRLVGRRESAART